MFDEEDPHCAWPILAPARVPRRSRYSAPRRSLTVLIIVLVTAGLLCCGLGLVLLAIRPQQEVPEAVPASTTPKTADAPREPLQPIDPDNPRNPVVQVRVVSARIGYVKLQPTAPDKPRPKTIFDLDGDEEYRSVDKLLSVEIGICNPGQQPVEYRTWRNGGVALADEQRRPCVLGRFVDAIPEGGCGDAVNIPAGGSIRDVLVFQPPLPPAQDLQLHLRGQNLGLVHTIRLLIPARSIQAADKP